MNTISSWPHVVDTKSICSEIIWFDHLSILERQIYLYGISYTMVLIVSLYWEVRFIGVPALHYRVDFIFLSFGIMGFIVEL